jgi:3-oxoacyl-[acyl-carrier protein] reductase
MKFNFEGKTVLITGASRGIGKEISKDFKDLGANVLSFNSADYDLSKEIELNKFIKYINEQPKIDICINNAGINRINNIEDILERDYDDIMHVNTKAPFLISQAVCSKMKKNNYGRIINVSSIFGHCTKEKRSCYTTSKFALVGMTKSMAVEMAQYNVLINSVAPGFTATELTQKILGEKGIKEMSFQVPMRRLAQPEEISKVVIFLASDFNTYITGQNIIVDGGFVNV